MVDDVRLPAGRPPRARLAVHHVLQRHDVPADGPGGGHGAGAARCGRRLPAGADVLRPDALQHRLRRGDDPAGAAVRRRVRRRRAGRLAVGLVRGRWSATTTRGWPSCPATPGWPREVRRSRPRVLELSELLVDRLGVEDVGAYFPRRVTYHPTCHSLRMLHVGDRPLRLLRAVRGHRRRRAARGRPSAAASAARSRSRTPTPRSRCCPTRCARSSTPAPRCA